MDEYNYSNNDWEWLWLIISLIGLVVIIKLIIINI